MFLIYSHLPPGCGIDQDFIEKNPVLTFPDFFMISVSPLIYIVTQHRRRGTGEFSFLLSISRNKSNDTVAILGSPNLL